MKTILLIMLLLFPAVVMASDWDLPKQPAPYPETRYTPIPNGSGGITYYGSTSGGGYSAYDAGVLGAAMQSQMDRDAAARRPHYVSPPLDVPPPYMYRGDAEREGRDNAWRYLESHDSR